MAAGDLEDMGVLVTGHLRLGGEMDSEEQRARCVQQSRADYSLRKIPGARTLHLSRFL